MGRVIEDYMVLYFGSSMFKIARLLFVALLSVHLFASAFYRVKNECAKSQDDVDAFYMSKGVDPTVSAEHCLSGTDHCTVTLLCDSQSASTGLVQGLCK